MKSLIKKLLREGLESDIYYHGSCKDFDRFENISNNASTTIFGNKLSVQGTFITKNIAFTKIFSKGKKCFTYSVKLLSNKIFDLRKQEHFNLYRSVVGDEKINFFKEEEYIIDGLPTWDNYPAIEVAHKNGFDGIILQEFSGDISSYPIESIMVFDSSKLKIIKQTRI